MKTKSISSSYHLSDQVGDLLDGIHLLLEVLGLQEVTEVSIIDVLTNLVEIKETLIDLNESSLMISLKRSMRLTVFSSSRAARMASRAEPHSVQVGLAMSWNTTFPPLFTWWPR